MTAASDADRRALDARVEWARVHRPALFVFMTKVRAGIVPTMIEAGMMLKEAGVARDEIRPIVDGWPEPQDDGFKLFMQQLQSFQLPDSDS